jgi:hypothetical protein
MLHLGNWKRSEFIPLTYDRHILDLQFAKNDIDGVVNSCEVFAEKSGITTRHLFRKNSYNHSMAEILNDHDGSFEAIPNRLIRKTPELLYPFKELENTLNISDWILTRYMTRFQPADFLKWRENIYKSIGKFLSISTTGGKITFKDTTILVPKYHAIMFNPLDTYCILPPEKCENWIVFMIPQHRSSYEIH